MRLDERENKKCGRGLPGVTLVELLVYMTILSLVTIGITQMVTQIQKANVQTVNLADQFSDADLALRRVQIKLGDSDKVEVADLDNRTPRGCLRLKNFEQYQRNAVYFDGRNQFLRGGNGIANAIRINGGMSRTVSVWVRIDPDHAGRSTVVTWGNGATAEFGIEIANGQPELQLNCIRVYPQTTRNLADGGWHHIAVTYQDPGGQVVDSNSTRMYIDGAPVLTAIDRCPGTFHNTIKTNEKALFIGRHPLKRQTGFKGLISDLRIWRRALSAPEIEAIVNRDPSADANVGNLHVRLALDNVTGSGIANGGSWAGAVSLQAQNFGTPARVKGTLVDQTKFHSFCMVDENNDGLHELWESETALALPQRVGGSYQPSLAREWVRKSEDIFVPSADGFFKVVGENPETAIANFAVGKGIGNQRNLQQKTQSKPLASTRITRRLELCTINASIDQPVDNVTAAPISGTLCSFDSAFIEIKDYIQGQHGRLHIKNVTWHGTGDVLTATNIPNMPARVTATWYKKLGILKLVSDVKLDTAVWGRVMANALYLPTGRSSDATVTFNFGIGALPFFEGGRYRMYDFVDLRTAPLSFDDAMLASQNHNTLFCGMRSYLATITSEAEQTHLGKVMQITGNGQWKSGWIGAKTDASRIFEWLAGPESGQRFWKGNGLTGSPYDAVDDVSGKPHDKFEYDRQPSFNGNHRQMLMLSRSYPWQLRYSNWGGGKEADLPWFPDTHSCDANSTTKDAAKCEPVLSIPGTAVAIHGHRRRGGGWFTSPDSHATCDEAAQHSVCGYYREFDDVGKEADARIGAQVTLKMDRFREFCLTPDNATP